MISVDIIVREGIPFIIDINGRAGSYGEMQEVLEKKEKNSLDIISDRCLKMERNIAAEEEMYLKRMDELSKNQLDHE